MIAGAVIMLVGILIGFLLAILAHASFNANNEE